MVIDYSRTINRYTLLDAYPLPSIEKLISKVSKYKIFSKIDLKSAYHQIPISSEEKAYTAFEACGNLFQFRRIPFGVTNGVACFQRVIDDIIRKENLEGVYVYLDDITVCGLNQEDHDQKLSKFLQASGKYNLTINKEKSEFSITEINLLGYNIANGIIKPDPDRLKPFLNLPPPTNSASLRRIIGMFAHYSKWLPRFSEQIKSLTKIESFPLSNAAMKCFENIKKEIAKSAVSAIDDKIPFVVETDASDHSIAGTLSQEGRPVAFFSRTLSDSERKHSVIEKEAYAIVECLRKWRQFLIGRSFKLLTDQKSVSFMFNQNHSSKIKNDKIERWRLELSNYNFEIIYRPGKENIVADTLTRTSCNTTILSQKHSLSKLLQIHQSLCHPGVTRMTHWIKTKNLPYSIEDIKHVITTCSTCAEIKPRFLRQQGTLIKATSPFERLAIDFKGPLPNVTRNRYLLTIIDEYSRFPFAYPSPDLSTETVKKHLTNLFSIFGMPAYIHSDRGTSFISADLKSFLNNLGIASSHSAPYNPKCNGQVERLNGTLWQTIQLALKTKNLQITRWETVLTQALHSIRSLLCTSTNATPHERMFNHSRRSFNGISLPNWLQPGKVLLKKHRRTSKYDPIVEEVELIESNPAYSFVRLLDGREMTVSNRHLAPAPETLQEEHPFPNIPQLNPEIPTKSEPELLPPESPPTPPTATRSSVPVQESTIEQRRSGRICEKPKYLKDYYLY